MQEDLRYLREETAGSDRMAVAFARSLGQLDLLIQHIEAQVTALQQQTEQSSVANLEPRVQRLESRLLAAGGLPHGGAPEDGPSQKTPTADFDYFGFEMRFRGSPEALKARQRPYLDYLTRRGPVVDLGCGRGEFLELLREAGTPATGVDADPDMVAYCQQRGLEVQQGDALEFLASQGEGSLGGVFSAQLIEHLAPQALVALFHLSFQKLTPRGVLLAETINPMCLLALASHYILDLSHEKPIHPDTAVFLAESAGFTDIEVRFTSPVPELGRLQPLAPPPESALESWRTVLNENAQKLNDLLFTYQDYALIARKPG
jgi:O-antigen chain-terminating methyltransferase